MSKVSSAIKRLKILLQSCRENAKRKKEKKVFESDFVDIYEENSKYNNSITLSYEDAVKLVESYKKDETKLSDNIIDNEIKDAYDVDIIIPMFNGATNNGIDSTLKSIIKQRTKYKYRVLIMDDGSADDSFEYVKANYNRPNIYVYSQVNAGQGVAKNQLLNISDSKYVMFLDCCDIFLAEDTIETFLNLIKEKDADCVCGQYINFIDENTIDYSELQSINNRKVTDISSQEKQLGVSSFAGSKIYKRELWNGMRFVEHCCFDDNIIKIATKRRANKVFLINILACGYKVNMNSLSKKKSYKRLDIIWSLAKSIDVAHKVGIVDDYILLKLSIMHIVFTNAQHIDQDDIYQANIVIGKRILENLNLSQEHIDKLPKYLKYLYDAILNLNINNINLIKDNSTKYKLI